MNAENACALLQEVGFAVDPCEARIERRADRWAVTLPDGRMAWFPVGRDAVARLEVERRVLDLLAARCSFRVPRVVHADAAGWQLRELVPGTYDPFGLYRRIGSDLVLAEGVGRSLGLILAEQHACARPEELDWLPDRLPWPEPSAKLWATLPQVVTDPPLLRAIEVVLRRHEAATAASGRVLLHGDLGLHNLVLTSDGEVAGVFDYDGAACADRHRDFRYLLFPPDVEEAVLGAALQAYETTLGIRLDLDLIRLDNAAACAGFLAFRHGTPPEEKLCGRTLGEDLDWLRWILGRLGIATA